MLSRDEIRDLLATSSSGDFEGAESILHTSHDRGIAPNEPINQCYRAIVRRDMSPDLKVTLIDQNWERRISASPEGASTEIPDGSLNRAVRIQAKRHGKDWRAPAVDSGADITDSDADWSRFLKSRYKNARAPFPGNIPTLVQLRLTTVNWRVFAGPVSAWQIVLDNLTVIENVRNAPEESPARRGKTRQHSM